MIHEIANGDLETKFGKYHEHLFYDGMSESIALVFGEVKGVENVLCRVHSHCISAHIFNSVECDCREQMEMAQVRIQNSGAGIVIWLNQEGRGNGHMALLQSANLRKEGISQTESYEQLGYKADARDFVRAAEIIKYLGVESICLLTNNPKKKRDLQEFGVRVDGTQQIQIDPNDNKDLYATYMDKLSRGHNISV